MLSSIAIKSRLGRLPNVELWEFLYGKMQKEHRIDRGHAMRLVEILVKYELLSSYN